MKLRNKIANTSHLATNTVFNIKIGEVENKTPDVSGLVKKTDHNAKMLGIERG